MTTIKTSKPTSAAAFRTITGGVCEIQFEDGSRIDFHCETEAQADRVADAINGPDKQSPEPPTPGTCDWLESLIE